MRYFYAAIMLSFCVIAFFYCTRVFYGNNKKKKTYRLFSILSFASGIWGLGYGMMFMTNKLYVYKMFRCLGVTGIVMFVIFGQIVICVLNDNIQKWSKVLVVETILGCIVIPITLLSVNTEFIITDNGIMTAFKSNVVAIAYTVYCIVIAGVCVRISFEMAKNKNSKRNMAFGKSFLKVEAIIGVGMFIDTLMPAIGINLNIPASTIFQFIGLEIVYHAVHKFNRNIISGENMALYVYRSFNSPVLVFGADNMINHTNKTAEEFFDLQKDEVTGKVLCGKDMEENFWKYAFDMSAPKGISISRDTMVVDAVYIKNEKECKIYIDTIRDEYDDYIGYFLMVSDMTEQNRNMRELEKARAEAEEANRAKSMFLANMSHEIRTPMNSILGFSELGINMNKDKLINEYFTDIHDSANALLATINDILDISKIESGKIEIVDAPYMTAEVFKEVSTIIGMQAYKKDIKFTMDIDKNYPKEMLGDKTRIREILINLLNNGIKYTKAGSVSLKAKVISRNTDNARVQFIVKDTGLGIKKENIESIFESFKRVDLAINKKTEGTGLGLSITKGLVECMGGNIKVDSIYGAGSTFTVEINQKIVDDTPCDLGEESEKKKNPKKIMFKDVEVLAVDDNMINLKVIESLVKMYGLDIDTVGSGEEAIEMCAKKDYDIVLMDQMMPVMDGIEAMTHIRELKRGYETGGNHKIIVLTANALNGVREEMIEAGFDEYLAKPVDTKMLEKTFKEMLPEETWYYTDK